MYALPYSIPEAPPIGPAYPLSDSDNSSSASSSSGSSSESSDEEEDETNEQGQEREKGGSVSATTTSMEEGDDNTTPGWDKVGVVSRLTHTHTSIYLLSQGHRWIVKYTPTW